MSADRLRVLLWSIKGAGPHYGGPGTSALRLYNTDPGRFHLELAHGRADHELEPVFEAQHLVRPFVGSTLGQLAYIRAGVGWMREHAERYDAIHALQAFEFTVTPCVEAERRGTPCAVKIAAHRADLADKPGWRGKLRIAQRRRERLKRLSAVIAISSQIEQELLEYGFDPERIARIPNGVNTERFQPAASPEARSACRNQLGWPDRPTILCIGGVTPRKRQHLLLGALQLATERGIDAQLALVGPPKADYLQTLRDRAQERGVADRLIHLDFLSDPLPAYQAADVFALPSESEGMPNAVLEAMACGLPIVGTRISGTTDLVVDGSSGTLIEAREDEAAEACVSYLRDPQIRVVHGTASRVRVETRFSSRAVLHAHDKLFQALVHRSEPSSASIRTTS